MVSTRGKRFSPQAGQVVESCPPENSTRAGSGCIVRVISRNLASASLAINKTRCRHCPKRHCPKRHCPKRHCPKRHCEAQRDEAISTKQIEAAPDCFAALAMTALSACY